MFNIPPPRSYSYTIPDIDYITEIYFGQHQSDSYTLKHEIARGLIFYALGRDNTEEIPISIKEGIAGYIEYKDMHNFNNGRIEQVKSLGLSLSEIYKLTSKDEVKAYEAGHVLVMFLEEKAPDLIDDMLKDFRNGNSDSTINRFENKLKSYEKDFSNWLSLKTSELNTSNTNNENNQLPDPLPPKISDPDNHLNDEVSRDNFFSKVEVIKIPGSKLEVELHHNTLDKQKIEKFRSDIVNTFKDFKESFNLRESTTGPYKLKLHVFDNIDSYHKNVSEVSGFKISSNNIGIAIPKFNNTNYIADIFISQDEDKLFVLKHELVHGLTYAAAGGKGVWFPKAIMEGIATFIDSKGKHNHINSNIEYTKSKNLSLSEIYKLTKSSNVDYYAAGSILVMFLEEKHPHLIDNALYDLRYKNSALVRDELEDKLKHYEKDFSNWLDHKVNSFKTNIDLSDLYNNIEERVVYTAEDANNYQFPVEQNQNDYQNSIVVEYYL